MDLKLRGNIHDLKRRVVVPANAVDTYELPTAIAKGFGALPHNAELLHPLFLYMMALNRIEVVRELN
jgi:hypothetical protein